VDSNEKIVYVSDNLISRVHFEDRTAYMSHYSSTKINAIKTSLLMDDPIKQHKNFVFFYKFQNSYLSKIKPLAALPKELNHLIRSDEKLRHLIDSDYVIDPVTQMKWSNKQLKLHLHIPNINKLPNCFFYYEHNQWYGTDKCHTHSYQYEIKNGEIFLLSKEFENF
jgi:hypothetical protein